MNMLGTKGAGTSGGSTNQEYSQARPAQSAAAPDSATDDLPF
jgi:hypothetical protein